MSFRDAPRQRRPPRHFTQPTIVASFEKRLPVFPDQRFLAQSRQPCRRYLGLGERLLPSLFQLGCVHVPGDRHRTDQGIVVQGFKAAVVGDLLPLG